MRTLKNPGFPIVAPGLVFLLGCAIFAGGTLIMISELAGKFIAL
ncbi:hypothetical protein J2W70_001628 [Pseudomonas koreensis]|nr:hypothetical protein [Pseudomonas koreensis]MDR7054278.1 hypothetical protein [Pseudomonas koreensis]